MNLLQRNNVRIRSLWLPQHLSDDDTFRTLASLHRNTHVEEVHARMLRGIQGHEGGEAVRDHLLVNRNIKDLDIDQWCIQDQRRRLGPEGATRIAQALFNPLCILKVLKLKECRIGNDGMLALGEALQTNTTLEELNDDGNRINLGEATRRDMTLQRLSLSH